MLTYRRGGRSSCVGRCCRGGWSSGASSSSGHHVGSLSERSCRLVGVSSCSENG